MNRFFLPLICLSLLNLPVSVFAEGLIYQLPEDGAWARYDVETRQGDVALPNGSITISSVGTEEVQGERCRWVEVAVKQPHPQQGNKQLLTQVFKLLIPEAHLGYQKDPLKHVERAWRNSVTDDGALGKSPGEVFDPTGSGAAIFVLVATYLHGPYEKVTKLPVAAVECEAGKFDCAGIKAESPFPFVPGERTPPKGLYALRLNRQVPFGVVSLDAEFQVEKDGKFTSTATQSLKLAEMGKDAKALVTLPADVTDIPDDAEAAVRLIAPRAASARDEQSWNVISRSEQLVKLDQVNDQSLALLIRNLPLDKDIAEAKKAEFQWLAKEPKRADLALAFRPVSATFVSPLQPSYISKVTAEVDGDSATGQIAFEAKEVYRGVVEYTAQRRDGKWAIVEFRLPARKLKTSLNDKGLWKIGALENSDP